MLAASGLIRTVAETTSAPTFMSEWGTLLGVLLGAILGGVAQIVAGIVQRRQEHDRENRDRKRTAYTNFLQSIDEYEIAIVLLHSRLNDGATSKPEEYRAALDNQIRAMHEFNSTLSAIHLQGPLPVREIAEEIRSKTNDGTIGEIGSPAIQDIYDLEKKLVEEMRRDLKIRGTE